MYDVFSIPEFKFPKNFLWGAATAGHQIEGNNIHSAFWADEQKWPVDKSGIIAPSGMACNHYNMVDEDIKIMTDLNLQAYRMSVEWSRIEPSEGEFCQEAIDHYLDELSKLKEKGIKVFVSATHFAFPLWFEKLGGMKTPDNLKYFERYLDKIVPIFAPYVDMWIVLNEMNLGKDFEANKNKMSYIRYHALGYHTIKKYTNVPVSSAHALEMCDPKRKFDKFDDAMSKFYDCCNNEFFIHAMRTGEVVMPFNDGYYDKDIKGTVDFWSINIYNRIMVDARKTAALPAEKYTHKKLKMIPMEFFLDEMHPEVLIHQLSRLHDLPIYITENGCSCYDDDFRIVYMTLYLCALHEAMKMGADVRGYLYWSLLDNYEWSSYVPRFGLVDVDFKTFERKIKNSGYFYKDIIQNNGFSQDILRKYLDKLPVIKEYEIK